MFVVAELDATADFESLVDSRTAANRVTFFTAGATTLRLLAGVTLSATGANMRETPHLFKAVVNGASSATYVDNTLYGSGDAGTDSFEPISIGANYADGYNLVGSLGEIIIVPTVAAGDIADVDAYLAAKWGITL
jgi:hypothetical protein